MNLIKYLLIHFVWNKDYKCAQLVLAPEWPNGRPYILLVRKCHEYMEAHNIDGSKPIADAIPKKDIADFYIPDKNFCGVIKGAYIARETLYITKLYQELGMEDRIVPFKIAFMTRLALHYDIDDMIWNNAMPYEQSDRKGNSNDKKE